MKFSRNKTTEIAATFAVCMIVLTIIARIADSYMLPEVIAGNFEEMSLQYPVVVSGEVTTEGVQAVYGTEGLRVSSVSVESDDNVEAGDVLFTYDADFLDERIKEAESVLKKLEIQLEAENNRQEQQKNQREQDISRAKEDYESAKDASDEQEYQAYTDMKEAEEKLEEHIANPPKLPENPPVETTLEDMKKEWEAEKELLEQDYEQKKRAYDSAVRSGEETVKNAKRQVENASSPMEDGSSLKLLQLEKTEAADQVAKLRKIKKAGGKVCAEISGKVQQINVEIGSIVGSGVTALLEDFSQPYRFAGVADEKTAEYLRVGDSCNIRLKEEDVFLENQKIEKVAEINSGMSEEAYGSRSYLIYADVDSEKISQSGRAELELVTESKVYQQCVPLTALHGGEGDHFIFVVKDETTTLGMQSIAVKVPVKVLEKNDAYAAVEGNIEYGSKVILRAGKSIGDGERIKVIKE